VRGAVSAAPGGDPPSGRPQAGRCLATAGRRPSLSCSSSKSPSFLTCRLFWHDHTGPAGAAIVSPNRAGDGRWWISAVRVGIQVQAVSNSRCGLVYCLSRKESCGVGSARGEVRKDKVGGGGQCKSADGRRLLFSLRRCSQWCFRGMRGDEGVKTGPEQCRESR